jgi:transcriptional regulator with XRE-family HTH domain
VNERLQGEQGMVIGQRIRQLREMKRLSQGDIEETTGLLRCYISRVENGHTVPSLETLERFAAALGVPLYMLFYEDGNTPETPKLTARKSLEELVGSETEESSEASFLKKLGQISERLMATDRKILLTLAKKLATRTP